MLHCCFENDVIVAHTPLSLLLLRERGEIAE
jgi:hypothetical protein